MRFDLLTLFPELVQPQLEIGITRRAFASGQVQVRCWNPRDFASDNYRTVDDRPYGGGPGMVMLAEPLEMALQAARERQLQHTGQRPKVVYLSPQGQPLTHSLVMQLKAEPGLVLLAGRYEGIDERVIQRQVDLEVSIGDYVLSGGELGAMVLMDAIVRQLPGVLNDAGWAEQGSFVDGLLDCPHYTRPEVYEGISVPDVLLSGNHAEINRWRLKQALGRTWQRRPELLASRQLTKEESRLLASFQKEQDSAETE